MKFRKRKRTIAAAVSIEPALYEKACRKVEKHDTNFSRYVRGLIREDLDNPRDLERHLAKAGV